MNTTATTPDTAPLDIGAPIESGGLTFSLWPKSGTVSALNVSVEGSFKKRNNFSFVKETAPRKGCHSLGDVTLRARPAGMVDGDWAFFSSASGVDAVPLPAAAGSLASFDITAALNATPVMNADPAASASAAAAAASLPPQGTWAEVKGKGLTCTSGEYQGSLGNPSNADACFALVKKAGGANYGIYRGDGNDGCYICDLADHGDPATWPLEPQPSGVVSFVGTGTIRPPPAPPHFPGGIPFRVTRSYEAGPGGRGFTLRVNVTNTHTAPVEIGALGLAMPAAGQQHGIESSVWNDPHVGLDHGFVEWVRVVVDEATMLGVPLTPGEGFEAWRPIMENTCGGDVWELVTHSKAWAEEWATNKQWPYYYMNAQLNATGTWPNPKSAWPGWHGHDTVPVTDFDGIAQPWNAPTSRVLDPGASVSVAVQFLMAKAGPRTRDAALAAAGKATMHAVPGYVITSELTTATLFVTPPAGATVTAVASSDNLRWWHGEAPYDGHGTVRIRVAVAAGNSAGGRARVSVSFSDGTTAVAHYAVPPKPSFSAQIGAVGEHWANDAWLPRDFVDPFGRSASVMPWDRENKAHVLDDSRAYDVGLSDDAGGGNPLGFAMKVGHAPTALQVSRLDDYIRFTLYGIKTDTALPPYKSLQLRPEDEGDTDGIRMTMYYYDNAAKPSPNSSGHFAYDYKEQDKCGHPGIEGGPNWCMSESNANATYRVFNYPHHCATYYAMYRVARYHDAAPGAKGALPTLRPWSWYLERAMNTTLKFGAPMTGVMDGTLFREVLRSLEEEADEAAAEGSAAAPWAAGAAKIRANMLGRATHFAAEQYPYGSEFAFDTTGQEEVVVWLSHFANATNGFGAAAKRTVDHILSYMRSSPTWPYHGGTRSWGDLGNNGKWMPSVGTAANFETRGNLHYRSGLNAIPLIEWFRANPDDFFLLEIAMGAQAGQLMNIDDTGAPSMMLHMLPHILDFDPHSGDYGLGFFGHTLEAGSYFVQHPTLGALCFLCDLQTGAQNGTQGSKACAERSGAEGGGQRRERRGTGGAPLPAVWGSNGRRCQRGNERECMVYGFIPVLYVALMSLISLMSLVFLMSLISLTSLSCLSSPFRLYRRRRHLYRARFVQAARVPRAARSVPSGRRRCLPDRQNGHRRQDRNRHLRRGGRQRLVRDAPPARAKALRRAPRRELQNGAAGGGGLGARGLPVPRELFGGGHLVAVKTRRGTLV